MSVDNLFEKLEVWKKSHQLTLKIYKLTNGFPKDERYSLTDQIRRSVSSIPANIVEGNERQSNKEFRQFLFTAKGSVAETKYHLILARDLGYLSETNYDHLTKDLSEISKMITGMIKYLKSKI